MFRFLYNIYCSQVQTHNGGVWRRETQWRLTAVEAGNYGLAVCGREKGKKILVLNSISATITIKDKQKDEKSGV